MPDVPYIAQLSDPHIGATWVRTDPVARLAASADLIRRLGLKPRALLVSGDLAEHAADSEYEVVRELLAPLGVPTYPVAGNHDDREVLRRHFDLPGKGDEPINYGADVDGMRLVVLDTTVPGEDHGALDSERLEWLDAELSAAAPTPTLLAMHHPPLLSGLPAMDALGLEEDGRERLREVIERHPHLGCIAAGHMHRAVVAELSRHPVVVSPSTYADAVLDFRSREVVFEEASSAGFAIHALLQGKLVSHIQSLT
jgi:3',5'-cyclic AMP phosphodiesterase CpdA